MVGGIEISKTPPHRSADLSTMCTTNNVFTRPWTIAHRWSLNRLYKPELRNGRRNRPWYRSTRVPIVAYKRDPGANFFRVFRTKKEKRTKKERKIRKGEGLLKLPQLRKSKSDALRQLFLDDFHKLLG